jgi:hypothetical protein
MRNRVVHLLDAGDGYGAVAASFLLVILLIAASVAAGSLA